MATLTAFFERIIPEEAAARTQERMMTMIPCQRKEKRGPGRPRRRQRDENELETTPTRDDEERTAGDDEGERVAKIRKPKPFQNRSN